MQFWDKFCGILHNDILKIVLRFFEEDPEMDSDPISAIRVRLLKSYADPVRIQPRIRNTGLPYVYIGPRLYLLRNTYVCKYILRNIRPFHARIRALLPLKQQYS